MCLDKTESTIQYSTSTSEGTGIDAMCSDKSESMTQHSTSTSEVTSKDNYKISISE